MNLNSSINPHPATKLDRYPYLFANLYYQRKKYFPEDQIKILSFGCSTGEELLTLRKYFPMDIIYGAEIDENSLHQARANVDGFSNVFIVDTNKSSLLDHAPFDLVLCNSVLCITTTNAARVARLLPFGRFQEVIKELVQLLSRRAIISILNSSYLPSRVDEFSKSLTPIRSHFAHGNFVPLFDEKCNPILKRIKLERTGVYEFYEPSENFNRKELFDVMWTNDKYISTERLDSTSLQIAIPQLSSDNTSILESSNPRIIMPRSEYLFAKEYYNQGNANKTFLNFFGNRSGDYFSSLLNEIGTKMIPRFQYTFKDNGLVVDLSSY